MSPTGRVGQLMSHTLTPSFQKNFHLFEYKWTFSSKGTQKAHFSEAYYNSNERSATGFISVKANSLKTKLCSQGHGPYHQNTTHTHNKVTIKRHKNTALVLPSKLYQKAKSQMASVCFLSDRNELSALEEARGEKSGQGQFSV